LLNPGDSDLENFLRINNVVVNRITYTGKKSIPGAIRQTIKLLKKNKTEVVHTHLFDANLVGLTAAKLLRIPKRIHTRHHSDYHHIYYPRIVKYDKFVNRISTHIISISQVVSEILIKNEHVKPEKIHLVHHGFTLEDFLDVDMQKIKTLKVKYNTNDKSPVIGVISRYINWKGIQYIIPAFKQLLQEYPNALLVLANANGNYKDEIKKLLQTLPKENVLEITFENDIFTLYQLFDVFVHVPTSGQAEAFGQTYIESLAAGIPSVFTLSGIANEFIVDGKNALVVPYKNSEGIAMAVKKILTDKRLSIQLTDNGKKDLDKRFGLKIMINHLENLYGK
jgi:glycosyltransferase involved in cell wall biosynthesis